jgi:hypothetical protein
MNISSNMNFLRTWSLGGSATCSAALPAGPSAPAAPAGAEPQDTFTFSQPVDPGIYKSRIVVGDSAKKSQTPTSLSSQAMSEAELRKHYATQAPHHEFIGKGKYAEASAAYRVDAAKLKETDPQRDVLLTRASQLEYTAQMQRGDRKVSFPPTLDELKTHFKGLRKSDAATVSKEFRTYANAFYQHVQEVGPNGNPEGDVKYDEDKNSRVQGERKTVITATPEDFKDVTDQRQLNNRDQRVIDCEGYAWLGGQLLGEAGFHQSEKGSNMLMLGHKQRDGSQRSHLMLFLKRDNGDKLYVSNNHAYDTVDKALKDGQESLALPKNQELEVYYGRTEREALVHGEKGNQNYRYKDKHSW